MSTADPSGEPGESAPAALRADGLRNRHRILVVARELFAERSPTEVQLEDVAAAAGVGRATLFRHIQSKDALIEEIYRERVLELDRIVEDALLQPTGWDGFAFLLRTIARSMHEDRGLYQYTVRMDAASPDDAQYRRVGLDLESVVARARAEGSIAREFAISDLLPLLGFTVAARQDRLDYCTEVLLRGLHIER